MTTLVASLAALLVVAGYAVGGNVGTVLMLAGVAIAGTWLGRKILAAWRTVDQLTNPDPAPADQTAAIEDGLLRHYEYAAIQADLAAAEARRHGDTDEQAAQEQIAAECRAQAAAILNGRQTAGKEIPR